MNGLNEINKYNNCFPIANMIFRQVYLKPLLKIEARKQTLFYYDECSGLESSSELMNRINNGLKEVK